MCTFNDKRTVQVCDVAISQVRAAVEASFGDLVRCPTLGTGGMLVHAEPGVDAEAFGERAPTRLLLLR